MSSEQPLVEMANQIGTFFETQGDVQKAEQDIASHLRLFWAPSMRADLFRLIDADHAKLLMPIVQRAVVANRDTLLRTGAHVAGEGRVKGPEGGGDAG